MSEVISATCAEQAVKVNSVTVPSAQILSKGIGESSGVLLIKKDKVVYLTSNAEDIEATIEKVCDALTKIGSILTSIGAGMTGSTTAPPGTLSSDISELNSLVSQLNTIKGELK